MSELYIVVSFETPVTMKKVKTWDTQRPKIELIF